MGYKMSFFQIIRRSKNYFQKSDMVSIQSDREDDSGKGDGCLLTNDLQICRLLELTELELALS